jgi:hypothetical protein
MMAFLKKLKQVFETSAQKARPAQTITVRCHRCGEIISARINLGNDLSRTDDGSGFIARKILMGNGENRCFQRVEVTLYFDEKHNVINREIIGGTFVDETTSHTE